MRFFALTPRWAATCSIGRELAQVFPLIRIAGHSRTLSAAANKDAAPIDLDHLPDLDFSYFDPWFEVARRQGVTRFEAHVENVGSERWQWALDTAFGKGRVQAGTPVASRVSAWIFRELKGHAGRQGFHGFFAKISDEILPEDIRRTSSRPKSRARRVGARSRPSRE